MWNLIRKMERRNWLPRRKFGSLGVTGGFAVVALALILAAGWVIDRRGASAADRRLAKLVKESGEDPVGLIVRAARGSRIVFLSDIHNSTATKQLAARAVAKVAASSGLDAVVLEIGVDQQQYIDQYLDHAPENASVLMAHAATLGGPGPATRAYLELYRAIWRLNQRLGPDQRIRVIAADLPGWPPVAPSPSETARLMAEREQHMAETIDTEVLGTFPDARILVFMTGFHALKSGVMAMQTGGSAAVEVTPLAARLGATTDEVYSFLVDAPSGGVTARQVAPYTGTRVADVLQEAAARSGTALTITSEFDYLRQPVLERKTPGIDFGIMPRDYQLGAVADAYIYLGN